eukprot:307924-Chlamydomonas_euryale.AAC.8
MAPSPLFDLLSCCAQHMHTLGGSVACNSGSDSDNPPLFCTHARGRPEVRVTGRGPAKGLPVLSGPEGC